METRLGGESDVGDDDRWAEDSDFGVSDRQLEEVALAWQKQREEDGDRGDAGASSWKTLLAQLSFRSSIFSCSTFCSPVVVLPDDSANVATRNSSRHKELEIEEFPSDPGIVKPEEKTLQSMEDEVYFKMVSRPRLAEYFQLEDADVECVDLSDVAGADATLRQSMGVEKSLEDHPRLAG